jgi:hypothetical protein
MIVVIVTFAGTLSAFPALVSEIWECNNVNNAAYTGILFTTFNVADVIGRSASALVYEYSVAILSLLFAVAFGKLLLIPLLAFGNIQGDLLGQTSCSDSYTVLLVCLLGLTNGICASCCMMYWPQVLRSPEKANIGATIMIFSVTLGLIAGSVLSYIAINIVLG